MVFKLATLIALASISISLALPNSPANCPAPGVQCCMRVLDQGNKYAAKVSEYAHIDLGTGGHVALNCKLYEGSCPYEGGIVCCNNVYYNGFVAVGCLRVA
ncbi:hypothetical protein E4T56_gene19841 [Termitomyces sp. T112]|nr:hypothetical protein E4T56_gene19841 [Termitomyces sp. T112]KAH0587872.1 hypothetical protein H2248_006627 [Termitomyces sp. 'cryptogamus']